MRIAALLQKPHRESTIVARRPGSFSGRRALASLALAGVIWWDAELMLVIADEPPVDRALASLDRRMQWVRIDHANNRPDGEDGPGQVGDGFMLGAHEVTNEQFCEFLNATACGRNNQDEIAWRTDATGKPIGPAKSDLDEKGGDPGQRSIGIIATPQPGGGFQYAPTRVMGPKPVVNLRWHDAARLANWLHNGAVPDAETDSGAYELDPRKFGDDYAVDRQPGARFWIPSLDEWYKAAYYDPFANGGRYHDFPTDSGKRPKAVGAMAPEGIGAPKRDLVNLVDFANIEGHAKWWSPPVQPGERILFLANVTSVGTNGRENLYGAFDLSGNAAELVTAPAPARGGFRPLACGGDFQADAKGLKSDVLQQPERRDDLPIIGGVRLARLVNHDDPPANPPGPKGVVQAAIRPLQQMQLPPRIVGQATPQRFQAHKDQLQRHLDRLHGNKEAPNWAKKQLDDAIKAIEKMRKLAEDRDFAEKQILQQAQALNGILPVGPAADALLRNLNDQYQADLRAPYNEFDRARAPGRQNR